MGMFEHFPYTNFHDLNLDWLLKTMKSIKDSLDDLWKQFLESRVPRGGDPNQVLTKTAADDFAMAWKDVPHELPEGGTEGQMLSKKSDSNYDVQWSDAPESLPEGGAQGQVLAKKSAENFDVEWVDQSGDTSKYLPLAGGTMDAGAVINSNGALTIQSGTLNLFNTNTHYDANINFTRPTSNFYTKFFNGHMKSNNTPSSPEDFTNKKYVDNLAVPAGGTTGQVLAKKSDTDRDCEWVDQSGGGGGDYLPLAGGTMNQDATINFTESGSGHSELSSGELHHTGNPFQFVGDFNFQTACPSTQGVPQTDNDLVTKGYVDNAVSDAVGGDFVKKTGDTMTGTLKISVPDNENTGSIEICTPGAGKSNYKQTLMDDTVKIEAVDATGVPHRVAVDLGPTGLLFKAGASEIGTGDALNTKLTNQGLKFDYINGASGLSWEAHVFGSSDNRDYGVEFVGPTFYRDAPKKDEEIVNKKYVDDAVAGASGGGSSDGSKTWFLTGRTIEDGNILRLTGLDDAWPKSGTACLEIGFRIGGTGNAAILAVDTVNSADSSVVVTMQAYKNDAGIVNVGFMTVDKTNKVATFTSNNQGLNVSNVLFRLTTPDHILT